MARAKAPADDRAPTRSRTRVEALVEPSLLIWAREASGLAPEAAAKKVGVKPTRLAEWETGQSKPTMTQLRKLAHVYRRPIAVFYLPHPPDDVRAPADFRRLPGEVAGVESPELRYEFRRSFVRREIALDLMAEEGEEPPEFPIAASIRDDEEELGSRIRDALGVEVGEQASWSGTYGPFNAWRAAIEDIGALVLQMTRVQTAEARGFSISEFPLPVIVANIKDHARPRTFTLLHEFAHVAIRQGGLCDLDDTTTRGADALRIEQFCNRVAGSALVPEGDLLEHPVVAQHGRGSDWPDEELAVLSSSFGVSREVVLRRLLDLGRTTSRFYEEKRDEFIEGYLSRPRREGFAPPHALALASAGHTFTGLVLSSYAHGHITASDVSDFLDVRLKHVPKIEEQLLSPGRAS